MEIKLTHVNTTNLTDISITIPSSVITGITGENSKEKHLHHTTQRHAQRRVCPERWRHTSRNTTLQAHRRSGRNSQLV